MDKFFTGAVVGFLVCLLYHKHNNNIKEGIHFLQKDILQRPDAANTVSGLISHNRVA